MGKSTAVRMFAQESGRTLIELNLERHLYLNQQFASFDLDAILRSIQGVVQQKIEADKTNLFLDEIQATPQAIAALRYFYEDMPALPVIAAGSLLEFALGEEAISMPVGRIRYFHLGPMTFEEFLEAKGESYFLQELRSFHFGQSWSPSLHQSGQNLLKQYLIVGGMPAVLASYLRDPQDTDRWTEELQSIVDTYKDDFSKYTRRKAILPILQNIYDLAPAHLSKALVYSHLLPHVRHEYIKDAVQLLIKAKLMVTSHQCSAHQLPLGSQSKEKAPKLFWLDCGLAKRMLGLSSSWLDHDFNLSNGGAIAEQFVAQNLQW